MMEQYAVRAYAGRPLHPIAHVRKHAWHLRWTRSWPASPPDVKFLIDTVLGNTGKLFINNTAAVIAICSVEPTNEDTLYRLSRATSSVGFYYLGAFAIWANLNFLLDFADPMRTFQFVKDCAVFSYVNHAVVTAPITIKKAK